MKVAQSTSIPSPALINGSALTILPAGQKPQPSLSSTSLHYHNGTPCPASLPAPATSMAHLTAVGALTRNFPTPNKPHELCQQAYTLLGWTKTFHHLEDDGSCNARGD
ncbi:hypothetical protein G7K_1112-t1 [Saitoella complicata NRRL Y-17804]|uniref:Uncharacterized protein n=1 Tax=Saitoella complicata (strain BCRC 22490 / CBS 7301 / JCM 7358 / NBRC 10748 / NRRL Y-17804) TaxID=698492 RepID=A0A0E9NAP4_SAICN|nr:hypothetical protein G7K_1112-t1 [Saitoella complicata NRRL Y-17804]